VDNITVLMCYCSVIHGYLRLEAGSDCGAAELNISSSVITGSAASEICRHQRNMITSAKMIGERADWTLL
jgi:hypothetical protein